jgi:hypothetical protein
MTDSTGHLKESLPADGITRRLILRRRLIPCTETGKNA